MLDTDIVLSEFELQWYSYANFQISRYDLLYSPLLFFCEDSFDNKCL